MEDEAGRKGCEEDAEGGKDPIMPNVGTVTSPELAREHGGSRCTGNGLELRVLGLATMIQGTSNWIQESPGGSDREA